MVFPEKPRYKLAILKSCMFLKKEGVNTFPFSIEKIIEKNNWSLLSYSNLANIQETSFQTILSAFGTNDGYTFYDGNSFYISYNDRVSPESRIRFTLLHEIAHICLNHIDILKVMGKNGEEMTQIRQDILEKEANAFARNALCPVSVVKEIKINEASHLSQVFGISQNAAKVRLKLLETDYKYLDNDTYKGQLIAFSEFIDKHSQRENCIICDNTATTKYHPYCKKCGEALMPHNLKNHCDNDFCSIILPVHARFCPVCGEESYYSMLGLFD